MIRFAIAVVAFAAGPCTAAALAQDPPAADSVAAETIQIVVQGRILDDAFQPAAGVPITHVTEEHPDVRTALKSPLASSDATGKFAIEVPIHPELSNALLIGGRKFAVRRYQLSKSKTKADLGTFAMPRGFLATGRVRTSDGKPMGGAVVVGSDLLDTRQFLRQNRNRQKTQCWTCAPLSARGIFMLPGMVRSAGEIVVQCPGYYDARISPVAMGSPLDVTLQPAGTARGRVVSPDGEPLAGVSVHIGTAHTTSEEDGSWTVQLCSPGVRKVRAWSKRSGTYTSTSSMLPGDGGPCEIELDLGASAAEANTNTPAKLRVQAHDHKGQPIEEFAAFVSWNSSNQMRYRPDAFLIAGAANEDNLHGAAIASEAALSGPDSSRKDTGIVFVQAAGHAWGRAEVDTDAVGGEPVVVKLSPPLAIGGRVLDQASEQPLANADIVVTPKADDNTRTLFSLGFWDPNKMLGPYSVKTGSDGRWSSESLAAGEYDVFVMVAGKIVHTFDTLDLKDAKAASKLQDIECKVGSIQTLRGTIEGASRGLEIRPHWHRENMSSSSWMTEYDGAVPIADDGTFALPDLAPVQWRPEVLLPTPPRGGLRRKIHCKTWTAGKPPEKPYRHAVSTILDVTGHVRGDVPWHRLAVLASMQPKNHFQSSFAPLGTIALLAPDRTFRLQLPRIKCRLILFDVLTGISIAFREVEAAELSQPVMWSGKAFRLTLDVRTETPDSVRHVTFRYKPDEDHWPMPLQDAVPPISSSGMTMKFSSERAPTLWLPERSGQLLFEHDDAQAALRGDRLRSGQLEVVLSHDAVTVHNSDSGK